MALELRSQKDVTPILREVRSMRDRAKSAVEYATSFPGFVRAMERIRRKDIAILAYHNVIPDSERLTGERPLHIPFTAFQRHLDVLEDYVTVCSLKEVLQADGTDTSNRLRVALTFDDAYSGALTVAVPELVRRGLPATIFAAAGLLNSPVFWWDAYDFSATERSEICLVALRGDGEAISSWLHANNSGRDEKLPGPSQRPGTTRELRAAAALPGIDIAGHSYSHLNLSVLTRAEVESELQRCMDRLDSLEVDPLPFVAFPYGLSSPVVKEVLQAGPMEAALAISGGAFRPGRQDQLEIPRLPVPAQASAQNLMLRILGLITA